MQKKNKPDFDTKMILFFSFIWRFIKILLNIHIS